MFEVASHLFLTAGPRIHSSEFNVGFVLENLAVEEVYLGVLWLCNVGTIAPRSTFICQIGDGKWVFSRRSSVEAILPYTMNEKFV